MAKSERPGLFALRVAGLALALTLVFFLFRGVDVARVGHLIAGAGIGGLVLIAIPVGLSSLFESLAWRRVFRALRDPVGLWPLVRVRIATEALSQTLPLGVVWSESIKPGLLARHGQVPTSRAIASAVARRYLLICSQGVYTALCAAWGAAALFNISRHLVGNGWLAALPWLAVVVLFAAALGVAGALAKGRLAARLHAALEAIPNERLRAFLARSRSQFTQSDRLVESYLAQPLTHSTWLPGFWMLLGWLCEALEAILIFRVLGVELSFTSVLAIEGSLAFLRNLVVFLPAGLGVQELGYAACLTALGVPHAIDTSAAFAILRRAKEVLWASAGYGLLLWDLRGTSPRWAQVPARKPA